MICAIDDVNPDHMQMNDWLLTYLILLDSIVFLEALNNSMI